MLSLASAAGRAFRKGYLHLPRAGKRNAARLRPALRPCRTMRVALRRSCPYHLNRGCWRRHLSCPLPSHPVPSLKQPKYAPLQRYHVTGFSFAAFPSGVNRSPVDRNSKSVISKKRTAVKQICLSMVPHLEAFFVAFLAAAERGGACHIGIADPSSYSASIL